MRFTSSLLVACSLALSSLSLISCDLRQASQPKNAFKVADRGNVAYVSKIALYMEPSDFNYAGLKDQRQNAYDNFLRSNIDNEQDRRNFNNEAGMDMLPFRTYQAALTDVGQNTQQNKIGTTLDGAYTATPGVPFLVPLRWNNPHASEIEVNVWIMKNQYVVPISLPTCSGEGHGDNALSFTIPTDFNSIGTKVPGFTGCKVVGDCVLQIYAHSVETRQYAIGTPLIVTGTVPTATATDTQAIKPAQTDVGTDLTKLALDICRPAIPPTSDIKSALPQVARLISDVYNHAYQNSDYSPYSGQQPQAISKNLQAAAILSMVTGNRGELGKALLATQPNNLQQKVQNLENKQKDLIKKYEGVTNQIIAAIQNNAGVKNTGAIQGVATGTTAASMNAAPQTQNLANCFRCAEVGSTTTNRQTTNTYVPSFVVPAASLQQAKNLVPAKYSGLINAAGTLGIYTATLNDLSTEFANIAKLGINYQPAAIKTTATTMADTTQFKKRNQNNQVDNGLYAAKQAALKAVQATKPAAITPVSTELTLSLQDSALPPTGFSDAPTAADMDGRCYDNECDNDTAVMADPALQLKCSGQEATQSTATCTYMFPVSGSEDSIDNSPTTTPSTSSATHTTIASTHTTIASFTMLLSCITAFILKQ